MRLLHIVLIGILLSNPFMGMQFVPPMFTHAAGASGPTLTAKTCSAQGGSGTSPVTCTWSNSSFAAGETAYCWVQDFGGSTHDFTAADSASNAYLPNGVVFNGIVSTANATYRHFYFYYSSPTTATTTTVTIVPSGANFMGIACVSSTGGSATPIDGSVGFGSSNPGTSATAIHTGIYSGTYTSGITATGVLGDTCTLSSFNGGGSGATATVALTGLNTIAGGSALTFTQPGTGYSGTTSATAGNGTALCSGTATVSVAGAAAVAGAADMSICGGGAAGGSTLSAGAGYTLGPAVANNIKLEYQKLSSAAYPTSVINVGSSVVVDIQCVLYK